MNVRTDGGSILIDVLVQPRASRERIGPVVGERLKIAVTSPPVDGAANAAVIRAVCKRLSCTRRDVDVVSGHSSRRKTIRITGVDRHRIEELAT